jgi:Cytochrome c554 and c-prime
MRYAFYIGMLVFVTATQSVVGLAQTDRNTLRPPSAFSSISDPGERSRAIFAEATKVLTHPRCLNCHPAGDRPTQANDIHSHEPFVLRDVPCVTCHTDRNFTLQERASYQSIPGHPRWLMAPIEMAWQGKSMGEICQQLKDRDRNGGRDLALLHEHLAHDDLVGWGWEPGAGREPAPGSQALLGELIQAWIDSGAQCP